MRRNYISPEFDYLQVFGSYNMLEKSSFFGSKMMEIEDSFEVTDQNLIYYQQSSGEQIDLTNESSNSPIVYDQSLDKSINHKLNLVELQSEFLKNTNTNWTMEIDLKTIFQNTIFATLKKARTFEGLTVQMVKDNDINIAIVNYIDLNIRSRYKLNRVEMYIEYVSLLESGNLKYNNKYDQTIKKKENKFTKFQSETAFDDSRITLNFAQEKPSNQYSFKYSFDLFYEKL